MNLVTYDNSLTANKLSNISSPDDFVLQKIKQGCDDPLMVADLGDLVERWSLWNEQLPRVRPFYAVKCNNENAIISVLAKLGCGFDCASQGELEQVLGHGVAPHDIVYANPIKQISHLQYAADKDVHMMTFESAEELHKIKQYHPDAQLILRIATPSDVGAIFDLSEKYGAKSVEIVELLQLAAQLELNVTGVSFHVGSGCTDINAFPNAVALAKAVYNEASRAGFILTVLDIGGGYPGTTGTRDLFVKFCSKLRDALDIHFPPWLGIDIIAEPGRYMVSSAYSAYPLVIGKKNADCSIMRSSWQYYLNDGIYGSFNKIITEPGTLDPPQIIGNGDPESREVRSPCVMWGPTCDSLDKFPDEYHMPELHVGDRVKFTNMGAYSITLASHFNSMPSPKYYYLMSEENWESLVSPRSEPKKDKKGRQEPKQCERLWLNKGVL